MTRAKTERSAPSNFHVSGAARNSTPVPSGFWLCWPKSVSLLEDTHAPEHPGDDHVGGPMLHGSGHGHRSSAGRREGGRDRHRDHVSGPGGPPLKKPRFFAFWGPNYPTRV